MSQLREKIMTFTLDEAVEFAELYDNAVEFKLETFKYRQQIFVTNCAKYLLEFLQEKFKSELKKKCRLCGQLIINELLTVVQPSAKINLVMHFHKNCFLESGYKLIK